MLVYRRNDTPKRSWMDSLRRSYRLDLSILSDSESSDGDSKSTLTDNVNLAYKLSLFRLQKFSETASTTSFDVTDSDFKIPPEIMAIRPLQSVSYVLTVLASPKGACQSLDKPLLYLFNDMLRASPRDFAQSITTAFQQRYGREFPRLRFLFHIDPTIDKLTSAAAIRRDVQDGRIIFHYVGFGFPPIDDDQIHALDPRSGLMVRYPIASLFESLGQPAWFIFDCSHAGRLITALRRATESGTGNSPASRYSSRVLDRNDWFCMCATSSNEKLPDDRELPRDFLTSCLLTPVITAVTCHFVQFYRRSGTEKLIVARLIPENSEIHATLVHELEAIADAVAADMVPADVFRKLFRGNRMVVMMFRRFVLAHYLLRPFQVRPRSVPELPDMGFHPLWKQWQMTVDAVIKSILSPKARFQTRLFERTCVSVSGFLDRHEEQYMAKSCLVLLFHGTDKPEMCERAIILLGKYAKASEQAREIIAVVATGSIFTRLVSDKFRGEVFHALCYLSLALLRTNPLLISEFRDGFDVGEFPERLFDKSSSVETKCLVAAILTTLIPHSHEMWLPTVARAFLFGMRDLLTDAGPDLAFWILMTQKAMFERSEPARLFFTNGIHVQVASFTNHHSRHVRAAAVGVVASIMQIGMDLANCQLFCITVLCAFDAAHIVRLRYVGLLSQFLVLLKNTGKIVPRGSLANSSFGVLFDSWVGSENGLDMLNNEYDKFIAAVDNELLRPGFQEKFTAIAVVLVGVLLDDPHPVVRTAAIELQHSLEATLPECIQRGFSTEDMSIGWKSSQLNNMDVLYRAAVERMVVGNEHAPTVIETPAVTLMKCEGSVSKLKSVKKWETDGGTPTAISFHARSMSVAIGTVTGNVLYERDDGQPRVRRNFGEAVTSLTVVDWNSEPVVIVGTESGCAHVWWPIGDVPCVSFRTELPGTEGPNLLAPVSENGIMSGRGKCGTVRLWNVETQRVVREWKTGIRETITALAVYPENRHCCVAGYSNGMFVSLDTRSGNVSRVIAPRADERILKVVLSVSGFFAVTNNSFIKCNEFGDVSALREGITVCDMDVHNTASVCVLTRPGSYPVVCDLDMKVIQMMKNIEGKSVCAFHPVCPILMFAKSNGDVVQYSMSNK